MRMTTRSLKTQRTRLLSRRWRTARGTWAGGYSTDRPALVPRTGFQSRRIENEAKDEGFPALAYYVHSCLEHSVRLCFAAWIACRTLRRRLAGNAGMAHRVLRCV